jgi:hypothetical protein
VLALLPQGQGLRAQAGKPIELVPHRAVYDMALGEVRGGAGVSSLSGRMVYEITGSKCNGYTQIWRYVTRSADGDGDVTINDQRSNSWEDGDGRRLRFESTNYRNRKLVSRVAGRAMRSSDNERIDVTITQPAKKSISFKSDAMFPIQHSIAMIEASRKGQRLFATDFYDGSENGEKIYHVSTLLGKKLAAGYNSKLAKMANVDRLDRASAWPVAVSYYERSNDNKDQVPTYEVSFVFFENGVSRRLLLDHGSFTVRGELKKIEFLETQPCRKDKQRWG